MPLPELILRPAVEADLPFLLDLRRRTMEPHLRQDGVPFDEAAHMRRIRYHWEDARIVLIDQAPTGLFKVRHDEAGWYVIQIQVDPARQGQGLGARLLRGVLARADEGGEATRLYVLKGNPARRLYERLGFAIQEETDIEFLMRRPPRGGTAA
ncbi:GNAT family N-acetyltransferase [Bordetella pseudohinzii]|uniref:Acetyltransferase n=1 Tax=Bordetella pseudohinzii TaxID=1331258 RepID=A0A0J6C124_9BORD|nr:GNAT family N-acetyltransferase [Bordetella pseudohinzii]ANY16441.1 acetyltransferase [Bordetella pseudohinzii]KMM27584.1 acetyltransferase [Bordetella pseudohinzii]KXA78172.1 acetyltransferase [Bordetella pseudohinzii]KXA82047.1 acetyltransferase [Bordetella pseudohinzii]CUI36699.1 Predicted acetyltransferase [Bordetella pseudohinzii]